MPDSMYDRLGDMLHDVLASGTVPARSATAADKQAAKERTDDTPPDKHGSSADEKTQSAEKMSPRQKADKSEQRRQNAGQSDRNIPHKKRQPSVRPVIPAEVRDALAFFGLNETAERDDAKKAYHEKLKYYHPDRHGDNPVLQKVAREKTRSVIAAWKTLERFFS